jgi:hypothetical protein
MTRMQAMTAGGLVPDMPVIRTPWIIDALMEIGPSEAGAMGQVPLSWASIDHWQRCIGAELQPWVCRLIRRLSIEFVSEGQRAREPDCPQPFAAMAGDTNRAAVSRKVSHAFRALIISKEPGYV